jgi:hypothetical protein
MSDSNIIRALNNAREYLIIRQTPILLILVVLINPHRIVQTPQLVTTMLYYLNLLQLLLRLKVEAAPYLSPVVIYLLR